MHDILSSKYLGRNINRKLLDRKFDLLYAPAVSASLAFLETDIPMIYHSDAMFRLAQNYYRDYSDLSASNSSAGELLKQRSLEKSKRVVFASSWAKRSAIIDYGICAEKIEVIPFVPNIKTIPSSSEINYKKSDTLRLLFVSADWECKGGRKVIEIYSILRRWYPNCHFRLVGGIPDEQVEDPNIEVLGFINKNNATELARLISIYLDSDFLILPTKAEVAGVVFAEASAPGVPCLTYDTGGTAEYVVKDVNGFIFPPLSDERAFADAIASVYDDPMRCQALRESTRKKYENEFSQEQWLDRFERMLNHAGIV